MQMILESSVISGNKSTGLGGVAELGTGYSAKYGILADDHVKKMLQTTKQWITGY